MSHAFAKITARSDAEKLRDEYLRRIDAQALLDWYAPDNVVIKGNEIIHSCLLDRVDPHHANGDANPSASLNTEKKVVNCIAPGAWVMTPDGGKPIEELVVGDLVLTHRGRYRPVTRTYSRHISEEVIEYRPVGSMPFLITKEHRMLTAARNHCKKCPGKVNGCRHVPVDPVGWHEAHEIKNHVVVRGRMTESTPVGHVDLPGKRHGNDKVKVDRIDLDTGILRLVGYYLSEGFSVDWGVLFTLNPNELEYADDIVRLSEAAFGVTPTRSLHRGALVIKIVSRTASRFFTGEFGTGCDKKLLPRWVMDLPWERQRELLLGLYRGDGSVSAQRQSTIALANPRLIYQVWQILSRIGARTGLRRVAGKPYSINGYEGIGRDQAKLTWADDCSEDYRYINDKSRHGFRSSAGRHSRYWTAGSGEECVSASWRELPYEGMVYDVEVEEDHSFVVEGVVSSNCYSYGGMDLFQFVLKMEGKDEFYEIIPLLGQFLGDGTKGVDEFVEELTKYLHSNEYSKVSAPRYHDRVLEQWDFFHPYLKDRGITFEAAERLRIGYDERSRRITIPHWVDGVLVGWQRRAVFDPKYPVTQVERDWEGNELDGGKVPKYKNSSGFPKYDTLYNLDRVRARGYDSAVVVESPMSVVKAESLWSGETDDPLGSVVATFSAKVGPGQIDLLRKFSGLTVWFDDDPSGHLGALKVIRETYRHARVVHVRPEPDKDLGDHTDASEVRRILAEAEPAVLALARLEKTYGR